MREDIDLTEQVAIVTGGASGIGEGIAKEFAKEGAHVVVADIDTENGQRVADDIESEYGVTALGDTTVAVDVQVSQIIGEADVVPTTIDVGYDTEADEFTSLGWLLEEANDPDYEAVVMDDAAENGSDELAEFRRKFIDTDGGGNHELPSSEYINHHAGKYSRYIGLGEEGQTVFELLLGEVRN